jgi:hypothetical protein
MTFHDEVLRIKLFVILFRFILEMAQLLPHMAASHNYLGMRPPPQDVMEDRERGDVGVYIYTDPDTLASP